MKISFPTKFHYNANSKILLRVDMTKSPYKLQTTVIETLYLSFAHTYTTISGHCSRAHQGIKRWLDCKWLLLMLIKSLSLG